MALVISNMTQAIAQYHNSATPFDAYYYDYKLANPALVGSKHEHVITTMGSAVLANFEGAPRTFYSSYEQDLEKIKSGIGAVFTKGKIGVHSYFGSRLLYSKQLPFSEKSGLRIGTQLLYAREKTNYRFLQPADPDELPNEIRHNFNVDFGLAYYNDALIVGASVKSIIDQETTMEKTTLNLMATREVAVNDWLELKPSIFFVTNFDDNRLDVNSEVEFFDWVMIGAGYSFPINGRHNKSFHAGINIKDWVQVLTLVYSSVGYRTREFTETYVEGMVRLRIPGRKKLEL